MSGKLRVALVVSHPIQHFCPQYASFANNASVVFKVFFASMLGLKKYVDPNFKQEVSWGNLQLDRFDHVFLNGEAIIPSDKNIDAPSLGDALSKYSPDVVITYGYFQKLQRRAYNWAKRNDVQLAYISDSENRQKRNRLLGALKYPFLRKYFSGIDYFFTVGDANESFYGHYGIKRNKFIRMHFPIDISCYRESFDTKDSLAAQVRQKHGIAEKDFVIGVVGKLVPWKNQDHIIDAMRILEAEGVYIHLLVAGSGEMLEPWATKASALKRSKVHFAGFVNVEQLPAYYAASDCYVHPASIEPHSIAISEAIYMGCPVIISSTCGSYGEKDDVQEGKNGWVYPFGDIRSLAAKIRWMVEHPAEREAFGHYSHAIAVKFQERAHHEVLSDLCKKASMTVHEQ